MTSLLHERFPDLRENLPHVALGTRPTPVRRLEALSTGAAEIWLKDDGAFGDGGWGGNKVRKLEWLIPDAQRSGRRTILTFGALGTNWGLAATLYARDHGLRTALALVDQPVDDHVRAQLERHRSSGATLHFTHSKARTVAMAPWLLARHRTGFKPPYVVPAGGSSPVGALGYVEAALELAGQVADGVLPEPSHVVVPVGTGGTTAGLLLGLRIAGLRTRVVGVIVNDQLRLDHGQVTRLARRTADLLRSRGADVPDPGADPSDLLMTRDWLGEGYGHATPTALTALARARDEEGLTLEPVYTAKALDGLLQMDADGRFGDGPVLFVNTNGPR
ncbi:1-aminocyclopropane-1-carboxylate deaminase/D-cysteine desulfhydrase [Aeromicrobium terrae]|uniref:Pyridoxal-phosphate dependent enzyme n=1 Tax=Aeromicrobium terrae TaxID=2498846 RepID=A0A5C8NFA9_9ACTN|nr:pyridoxal-phosphate dependent enzyme [Aeromicrobium terrae]TXL56650.1 pyridoxal-phosphate dependent enzyme [Aeromicrobium terrae]